MADEERVAPIVINAGDLQKALKGRKMPRTEFHGEHGEVDDDPDFFAPVTAGINRVTPKIIVRADPHGATMNVTSVRMDLSLDELEELIPALEEARDYLTTHGK